LKVALDIIDGVEETVCEHEQIMAQIRARCSDGARSAMERHIRAVAIRAGISLVG
jgi:DNA-binding FadR family transcriptional regulator